MLNKIWKLISTLLGALCGYLFYRFFVYLIAFPGDPSELNLPAGQEILLPLACAIIFGIIFFRAAPSLGKSTKKLARGIEANMSSISTNRLFAGIVGLIFGLIIAYLISRLYTEIADTFFRVAATVFTYIVLGSFGAFITSERAKDLVAHLAGGLKAVSDSAKKKSDKEPVPKIMDTSVIIDGRILGIMESGFLEGPFIIPGFVLLELQYIADSSDSLKRVRGRRGLDILNDIQEKFGVEIYETADNEQLEEIPEVDIKLLKLAQQLDGKVVTNDFNLNKVAKIKDIDVLNINELANIMKPVVLPGEKMNLLLVKEGKEKQQALAYLDDGTMIVVEDGKRMIGQKVDVEVTTVLQTSAGRMIFGKPVKKKDN